MSFLVCLQCGAYWNLLDGEASNYCYALAHRQFHVYIREADLDQLHEINLEGTNKHQKEREGCAACWRDWLKDLAWQGKLFVENMGTDSYINERLGA